MAGGTAAFKSSLGAWSTRAGFPQWAGGDQTVRATEEAPGRGEEASNSGAGPSHPPGEWTEARQRQRREDEERAWVEWYRTRAWSGRGPVKACRGQSGILPLKAVIPHVEAVFARKVLAVRHP